jgi:hypothetical protein
MWYAVWRISNSLRHDNGNIGGFITQEDEETPKAWDSQEDAERDMSDHIMKNHVEYIDL